MEKKFTRFYMRRSLRIFPLYYAALIVIFVLLPALHLPAAAQPIGLLGFIGLAIALTILLALVVYRLIETPFNRLKRHYEYGTPVRSNLAPAPAFGDDVDQEQMAEAASNKLAIMLEPKAATSGDRPFLRR